MSKVHYADWDGDKTPCGLQRLGWYRTSPLAWFVMEMKDGCAKCRAILKKRKGRK